MLPDTGNCKIVETHTALLSAERIRFTVAITTTAAGANGSSE